jgi:selenide,water dikinase
VDEPFLAGYISAVHAASDLDVTGAVAREALLTLGWPRAGDFGDASMILKGAALALKREYRVTVGGGHLFATDAPQIGVSMWGTVKKGETMTLDAGRPGNALILASKAIGSGAAIAEIGDGVAEPALANRAINEMMTSNRAAARAAVALGVRTGTDVTGSGLVGTLHTLAEKSGCEGMIWANQVPLIEGILDVFRRTRTAATKRNLDEAAQYVQWGKTAEEYRRALGDGQTSGPALFAVDLHDADEFLRNLRAERVPAAWIGGLINGTPGRIHIDDHGCTAGTGRGVA